MISHELSIMDYEKWNIVESLYCDDRDQAEGVKLSFATQQMTEIKREIIIKSIKLIKIIDMQRYSIMLIFRNEPETERTTVTYKVVEKMNNHIVQRSLNIHHYQELHFKNQWLIN